MSRAPALGLLLSVAWLAAPLGAQLGSRIPESSEPRDPEPREPRRLALLIGISDYRHFDAFGEPGKTDLDAPLHDVERIRLTLRRFGFDGEENVRVLLDADASKQGIRDGFRWLAQMATDSADAVVIYYSGHGTYADDLDGDEVVVTPGDERDEALVPWDAADIHAPEQLVLDDEIRAWLAALGTANVTLIIDACYSGTASRGAADEMQMRARGPVGNTEEGAAADPLTRPGHALLTAATAGQLAWEAPLGEQRMKFGVFTYHLTQSLDGASPVTRYDELIYDLRRRVQAQVDTAVGRRLQTPQLEGEGGSRLFGVGADVPHRAFVLVSATGNGRYAVDAGAVHGVRISALYDVHPPGEIAFGDAPLGHIRIDSVAEMRSYGAAVNGSARFPEGSRATLARVPVGTELIERLGVYVEPGAEEARDAVASLPFTDLAEAASADARIRRRGGVLEVVVADRSFALPPLDESAPGVRTGEHGGQRIVGFAPTAEALCDPLQRALAIALFGRIENPAPPIELDVRVRLIEDGMGAPEEWGPSAELRSADTAYVGRKYRLWAWVGPTRNHRLGSSTFYLTAALEGYTSEPWVVYPEDPGNRSERVELETWIPLSRRYVIEMGKPAGPEVIKVVANSDQYDFHALVGELSGLCPGRGGARGGSRAEQEDPRVVGWKAVEHTVLILPESEAN